jgi:hypothetical protein
MNKIFPNTPQDFDAYVKRRIYKRKPTIPSWAWEQAIQQMLPHIMSINHQMIMNPHEVIKAKALSLVEGKRYDRNHKNWLKLYANFRP